MGGRRSTSWASLLGCLLVLAAAGTCRAHELRPAPPDALSTPKDHPWAARRAGAGLAVAAQMIGSRLKPGRLFMYTHDGIGNRQWAVMGSPAGTG
ncbi:MAG TPA: hypothetical protein VFJ30_06455, partial [Phycisphaerae bacterium]|nr:hypothetical protein [Phycisphaerae bacterium]